MVSAAESGATGRVSLRREVTLSLKRAERYTRLAQALHGQPEAEALSIMATDAKNTAVFVKAVIDQNKRQGESRQRMSNSGTILESQSE